ncbi:MAG: SMC family ATPase [Candidatus Aenigmarchaeota archaeon]|nr:SMC family ATPase [Candidatus Aenigmarchaeota archaeon]
MITKIILKNWRSHLNSTLDFTKGTNALIGIMGSGKSSILGAMCFGLFGTTPELQSRKLKLDELIMNKPSMKDMAEVEVFFMIDGKNYSVKRIIEKRKGTTYSEFRENGKLVEAPSTQRVNEIVEKTLKADYELFSKAIYSEQNSLDYFLTIPKGQRMRKIDELLLIDKFDKARTNAISLINKISEKKSAMENLLSKVNVADMQQTAAVLKSSLEGLVSERSEIEKTLKQISSSRSNLENELKILYKTKENFEILKRDDIRLSSAINEIQSALEKLDESVRGANKEMIEGDMKSLSEVSEKLEELIRERQSEYQKIVDQFSKAKAEADIYRKETITRLKNELEEKLQLQKDAERIRKHVGPDKERALEKKKLLVEKYVGEIEALRIKIEDLGAIIDQLSLVKAVCPICESKLTEARKIILTKQKKMQVHELRESMDNAVKQKQMTEQDLKELEISIIKLDKMLEAIGDVDEIKTNLENSQHVFSVLEESSVKLEAELKSLRSELERMNKSLSETREKKQKTIMMASQIRDYDVKRSRISELVKERDEISRHLEGLERAISGKDLSIVEAELRNLVGQEQSLSARLSSLKQLSMERENRLRELESTLSTSTKDKEDVKKLENISIQLRIFAKALEETQKHLRQEFITLVNYSMEQLWQTLYPYQDFTGVRLNVDEGDYVLQLQSKNEWFDVEGVASGGERSIAALTLRIAFSLVLAPQLRILVLDEPTANLDENGISKLAETLRDRTGEFLDQIFIITHEPRLEEAITGSGYRLDRDKSGDGYTQVVQLN